MELNTLEVTEQPEGLRFTSIRELVNRTLNQNFGAAAVTDGIPSGFNALDKVLGGFKKGHLYTVAVRPGMGKTAFLLSLVNNMAIKNNFGVAIFSFERSNTKMTSRLIESETGMSLDKLVSGQMKESERDHMLSLLGNIAKAPIFIDDSPAPPADQMRQKMEALEATQAVDAIVIDYLELLSLDPASETDRPALLERSIEHIRDAARKLDLPVLLFSQSAGYSNGHNQDKQQRLSALPEFIRKQSDVSMLLHRRDAFPRSLLNKNEHSVELVVTTENPGAEVEIVPLNFIESIAKFTDIS